MKHVRIPARLHRTCSSARGRGTSWFVAAALTAIGASSGMAAEPALLPRPASVTEQAGKGLDIATAARLVVPPHDAAALVAAQALRDRLLATTSLRPVVVQGSRTQPGDIAIATDAAQGGGDEGYALQVTDYGVSIRARSSAGLFYGTVSLWQLLTEHLGAGVIHLAPVTIADQPRFAWRGLMLDSARHMQSVAYIKQFVDWMALHKLNTLHWHLADDQGWRIEIKRYPRLTSVGAWRQAVGPDAFDPQGKPVARYGGFYTQTQIREIVAFAAARQVTIVPEIDLPGHSTALIAAYPRLGVGGFPAEPVATDWGLLPEVLNTDDATFATVQNILTEVMTLFPGRFIHLGGDEANKTQWKASHAIQAKMRALGIADEDALERWFIGRLGGFLETHGRRLIGWDEIQEGATGAGLDARAAVMSWHGGEGAAKAITSGHDVVIAQAPLYYLDNRESNAPGQPPSWSDIMTAKAIYQHDPVPAGLSPAGRAHVLGLQGQLWTERLRREAWITALAYPRAAAIAEVGWSPAGRLDWASFDARMGAQRGRYRLIGLDGDDRQPAAAVPVADNVQRRSSVDLDFCDPNTTGLFVEAPPGGPAASPLVKVAMRRPCWVFRGVGLAAVKRLELSAVHLTYNERLGSRAPILDLPQPRTPAGEIDVHLDRADGPLIASLPLEGWPAAVARHRFSTRVNAGQGVHDLFFVLTGPDIDTRQPHRPPLTVVDEVELR